MAGALFVGAQRERLAHHLVEVHGRPRRVALAGERLQVADDARGAFGGVVDGVEVACASARRGGVPLSRSAQARIVASGLFSSCATPDIVWPSAASLLGLRQLLVQIARLILQLLALGDVAHHGLDAQRAAPTAAARPAR